MGVTNQLLTGMILQVIWKILGKSTDHPLGKSSLHNKHVIPAACSQPIQQPAPQEEVESQGVISWSGDLTRPKIAPKLGGFWVRVVMPLLSGKNLGGWKIFSNFARMVGGKNIFSVFGAVMICSRWFNSWPLFGGHDSPLKGSRFHHPKKGTSRIASWRVLCAVMMFPLDIHWKHLLRFGMTGP